MKNVLVVCPTRYDRHVLGSADVKKEYAIFFGSYDMQGVTPIEAPGVGCLVGNFEPHKAIEELTAQARHVRADAVVSSGDYPGSVLATIIAHSLGLVAPSVQAVISSQHKYLSRIAQQAFVPEVTPAFHLFNRHTSLDKKIAYPFFVKAIKSLFSAFAYAVNSPEELEQAVSRCRTPRAYQKQFDWFVNFAQLPKISSAGLLAEELLSGTQVTVDVAVVNGAIQNSCIVDSIMFPGTISFERFEYPSSLPQSVQERMVTIAERLLRGIGFGTGMCNIEYMYNPATDTIGIIEVNPRASPQFCYMYKHVDGQSQYPELLRIACGQPSKKIAKGRGAYAIASCFVFRLFADN